MNFSHSEITKPPSMASIAMKRDHHAQTSQLVELCKNHELSQDDIKREVSEEHILEIYAQLEKWKQVAAHLRLTREDVEAVESRARTDEELMRLYMLQEWKKRNKINKMATYQVLLEALLKCTCSKSAVKLCELLKSLRHDDTDYKPQHNVSKQHTEKRRNKSPTKTKKKAAIKKEPHLSASHSRRQLFKECYSMDFSKIAIVDDLPDSTDHYSPENLTEVVSKNPRKKKRKREHAKTRSQETIQQSSTN